jgi:hypothetical protein
MEYVAGLADPLSDVRDVVESFRCCGVISPDWRRVLNHAVTSLEQLPRAAAVQDLLAHLVPQLQILVSQELGDAPLVVDDVASRVAEALRENRAPGIPVPSDDDWSFGSVSAS